MSDKLKLYCAGGLCCFGCLLTIILVPVSIQNVAYDEYAIRYDDLTNQIHSDVYVEGKYVCTPQTTMFTYKNTVQKLSLDFDCLTSNGIEMYVAVDIQTQIPKNQVFQIFDEFGESDRQLSYIKLVAADSIRDSCGKFTAQDFYLSRAAIQLEMELDMVQTVAVSKSHINVTSVVLSNFEFPPTLDTAIQNKRAAENDIEIAENEREGQLTEAETSLKVAVTNAERLQIEAAAEVDSLLAEAEAKKTSIEQVWENRLSVYESIKTAMNMTASQFVDQYLASVVLQAASNPVTNMMSE